MIEKINPIELINNAQKYSEELADWEERHNDIKMTDEQHYFVALQLAKLAEDFPFMLLRPDIMNDIAILGFWLGYRSGWEASKTDSLLGIDK